MGGAFGFMFRRDTRTGALHRETNRLNLEVNSVVTFGHGKHTVTGDYMLDSHKSQLTSAPLPCRDIHNARAAQDRRADM